MFTNSQFHEEYDGGSDPRQVRQEKARGMNTGSVVALALCCSLLGGFAGAGSFAFYTGAFTERQASTAASDVKGFASAPERQGGAAAVNVVYAGTDGQMTATEIYAANVNSTVGITTSVTTNYFGYQTTAAASGSGFILTQDGYIATNYHVIEDASSIKVTTYDDSAYDAVLIGYDDSLDLAILKIEAVGLTPVLVGDSDATQVGDGVVAIGNPLGELTFSITSGIVSALNREVTINNLAMNLIQTDCAINAGNSGGALFNMYGQVIGITNAKYSGSGSSGEASIDNIGFAIPINAVRKAIASIIETGTVEKPYIGVSLLDLGMEYRRYGLFGAAVQSVEPGSPAETAGLLVNDVIMRVNGAAITGSSGLRDALYNTADGESLTLTVYREGQTMELTVTPERRQMPALPIAESQSEPSFFESLPRGISVM